MTAGGEPTPAAHGDLRFERHGSGERAPAAGGDIGFERHGSGERAPAAGGDIGFERHGSGAPLLLIHGSGGSRGTWRPVLDRLAARREVIAIDVPGHGASPPVPDGVPPTPAAYAGMIAALLREIGLGPVDTAGVSLGGWTALELAKQGAARSVVAIAPAGLWHEMPTGARLQLKASRRGAKSAFGLARPLLRTRPGRWLLMRNSVARPAAVPPADAIEAAHAFRSATQFDEHLAAIRHERFRGGRDIAVPVTVAFAGDDWILRPRKARVRDELPAHTRWLELPGCGHIPMWDDPELVARTILEGTVG